MASSVDEDVVSAPIAGTNPTEKTRLISAGAPVDNSDMTFRQKIYDNVNGELDSPFEYLCLYLIFVCAFLFVLSTLNLGMDPATGNYHFICNPPPEGTDECKKVGDVYAFWFEGFEAIAILIFTIEYTLRVWSCVEDPEYEGMSALQARWSFCTTFFSLIDVVAILPYYLAFLPGWPDSSVTQSLRTVRLFRLLKAEKYVNAFALLGGVVAENSALLIASAFYATLALVFSATLLYYTEKENGLESEKYFQSIPEAMFPCVLMLTGEYPISDFSPIGQFIASGIAVIAVAIFAVPTGVLGSGFVKAIQDAKGIEFTVDA